LARKERRSCKTKEFGGKLLTFPSISENFPFSYFDFNLLRASSFLLLKSILGIGKFSKTS